MFTLHNQDSRARHRPLNPPRLALLYGRTCRTAVSVWRAVMCQHSAKASQIASETNWLFSPTETSVAGRYRPVLVRIIVFSKDSKPELPSTRQGGAWGHRDRRMRLAPVRSQPSVSQPTFPRNKKTKSNVQFKSRLRISKPSLSPTQKQPSDCKIDHFKNADQKWECHWNRLCGNQ